MDGDLERDGRCVALYRKRERLAGALTIKEQTVLMKYRGQMMKRTAWQDGRAFAEKHRLMMTT